MAVITMIFSYDIAAIVLLSGSPETVLLPVGELSSLLKMNQFILLESHIRRKTNNCL